MNQPFLEERVISDTTTTLMKVLISRTDLVSLINKVQTTIPNKPSIPILSNLLIEASNNLLTLTGSDLSVSMKAYAEAKVLQEGGVILPAKQFFPLIRELTHSHVEIEVTTSYVAHIRAGSSIFKLHGIDPREFPSLPDFTDGDSFTIHALALRELFTRTAFAAAKEDSRQVLNGTLLQLSAGRISLVSTDGKKLAKIEAELPSSNLAGQFIIPLKGVDEMIKILNEDSPATVRVQSDKIAIETHSVTLVAKLLAGDYPDVNRVIPTKVAYIVSLHREELISLLKQVSLFTSTPSHSIRFIFQPGELELIGVSHEFGEGRVSMPVDYHGDRLELAYNPSFFIDILRHCKDETVKFGMIDAFNPGLITDQTTALFVIMPMRLTSA